MATRTRPARPRVTSAAQVSTWVSKLTAPERLCRGRRRHDYEPRTVVLNGHVIEVVTQCACGTWQYRVITRSGKRVGRARSRYQRPYLLPKGTSTAAENVLDGLTLNLYLPFMSAEDRTKVLSVDKPNGR